MPTAALLLATSVDLTELKVAFERDLSMRKGGSALLVMDRLRGASMPYLHSSHYLAFMLAYLQDEGVLPDNDEPLTAGLGDLRGNITDVLPRRGVDVGHLDPAYYDVDDLRREFHAGGPLSDPAAGVGLLDAIGVLRSSLGQLEDDGALIVEF